MEDLSNPHQTITTKLDGVGGESLADSGFEAETPDTNFVSSGEKVEE